MNILPKIFCMQCGREAQLGQNFCGSCGSNLKSPDAKPPVQPQTKPQSSFTPMAMNADGSGEDDDDKMIAADRIQSLSQLNLHMNGLEIDLGVIPNTKETVASIAAQGQQMPKGYQEPRRPTPPQADNKAFLAQFQHDAGTASYDPKLGN